MRLGCGVATRLSGEALSIPLTCSHRGIRSSSTRGNSSLVVSIVTPQGGVSCSTDNELRCGPFVKARAYGELLVNTG